MTGTSQDTASNTTALATSDAPSIVCKACSQKGRQTCESLYLECEDHGEYMKLLTKIAKDTEDKPRPDCW